MSDITGLISRHGYAIIALFVFLEAMGIPLPASVALLAAGAASALGALRPGLVFFTALPAMLLGDCVLFTFGRYTGWTLLGILCRISANPESCILRSAESFYKRGKLTLVFAKFIPGINTMAPPLAGSMNMHPLQFLQLDFLGASLYILAYTSVGYLFSGLVGVIIKGFHTVGRGVEWAVLVGIIGYVCYHIYLYWKNRVYRIVPRVQAQEVAQRVANGDANILLVDVRSHGYYDADSFRIHGSMRVEPNNLRVALHELPKDKDIYLYCT